MGKKKEVIQDQTAAAIGGLVGGGLGALAGPEGMPVGAAAGSVGALIVSKYAPEFLRISILQRYLSNRKIAGILKAKIIADLRNSFVGSQGDFDHAMRSMRSLLETAAQQDASIGTVDSRLPRSFRWVLARTDVTEEALRQHLGQLGAYCEQHGSIRIGCSAICAAAVAIFRDLHDRFSNSMGVRFDVLSDEINGRAFFDSLRSNCDLDFALGPLEALVFSDEERQLPLRLIGPLFGERQHVYVSTKKRSGFRSGVWVFDRSSAKFQYQVGLAIPRSAEEQAFDNARDTPDLVESIPPGDMIVAWDPLSSVLDGRRDYSIVPQSNYMVHFILLGHLRVFRKNKFPLHDFLAVLLAEWRSRRHQQVGLFERLRRDQNFMEAFASGAGHHWTPEV